MTDLLTDPAAGSDTPPDAPDEVSFARAADLVVRIVIVCAAALCAGIGVPTAVSTILIALAAVVVVVPLVRRRELGWEDALLVGVAGVFLVLVPLGLVLNLFPAGLTGLTWALGVEAVGVAAVVWDWSRSTGTMVDGWPAPSRRTVLRTAPWYVAALALIVTAIAISVHATDVATQAPTQLAVTARSNGLATVDVTGGPGTGRYELVVRQSGKAATSAGTFTLDEGQQVSYRVAVATGAPTVVVLRDTADDRDVRTLRLQPAAGSVR